MLIATLPAPAIDTRTEPPSRGGKYRPLYDYLKRRRDDELVMTTRAVEIVLKAMLPNGSRAPAWWSMTDGAHAGARAWTAAGFGAELQSSGDTVRFFRRSGSART